LGDASFHMKGGDKMSKKDFLIFSSMLHSEN